MLYKLILVDDERKIRETLSRIIDWKSLGFEIAGTFESAERAIRYIDNHIVDCVLSDIRMTICPAWTWRNTYLKTNHISK
jgi:two-component system response regulator YesN